MYAENKRRDREAINGQEVETDGVENGMLVGQIFGCIWKSGANPTTKDKTEIENKGFRYVL